LHELQCVAVCCSVLQCVACTAVCCSIQFVLRLGGGWAHMVISTGMLSKYTATHCNTETIYNGTMPLYSIWVARLVRMWHDSFVCVSWLIYVCTKNYSHVQVDFCNKSCYSDRKYIRRTQVFASSHCIYTCIYTRVLVRIYICIHICIYICVYILHPNDVHDVVVTGMCD